MIMWNFFKHLTTRQVLVRRVAQLDYYKREKVWSKLCLLLHWDKKKREYCKINSAHLSFLIEFNMII